MLFRSQSIDAVYKHAKTVYTDIVLMGWSLGAAPTLRMALREAESAATSPIRSVVLLSPFVSAIQTKSQLLSHIIPTCDIFDHGAYIRAHSVIRNTRIPIVIAHGRADSIIPCAHSEHLKTLLQQLGLHVTLNMYDDIEHNIPTSYVIELVHTHVLNK